MTDAITPPPRSAQSDSLLRKGIDRTGKLSEAPSAAVPQSGVQPPKAQTQAESETDFVGFADLRGRINQEPEFDRAKVDAIRNAIQNGQYPLDPRRIAESFVAIEQMISD